MFTRDMALNVAMMLYLDEVFYVTEHRPYRIVADACARVPCPWF